jgi:hypothetical protein
MKHVTQKLIEVGGHPVDVKARIEKHGWVVITFTPAFSIRSSKLHLPFARDTFINAIVCGLLDNESPDYEKKFAFLSGQLDAVKRLSGFAELPKPVVEASASAKR